MIASFNMLALPGKNCTFCLLATTTEANTESQLFFEKL